MLPVPIDDSRRDQAAPQNFKRDQTIGGKENAAGWKASPHCGMMFDSLRERVIDRSP